MKTKNNKKNQNFVCPHCEFIWQVWHKPERLKVEKSHCRECDMPIIIYYVNMEVTAGGSKAETKTKKHSNAELKAAWDKYVEARGDAWALKITWEKMLEENRGAK